MDGNKNALESLGKLLMAREWLREMEISRLVIGSFDPSIDSRHTMHGTHVCACGKPFNGIPVFLNVGPPPFSSKTAEKAYRQRRCYVLANTQCASMIFPWYRSDAGHDEEPAQAQAQAKAQAQGRVQGQGQGRGGSVGTGEGQGSGTGKRAQGGGGTGAPAAAEQHSVIDLTGGHERL